MKKRLIDWWLSIRGSYWFIPALMSVGAFGLAHLMPFLDSLIVGQGESIPGWIYGGGAEGARSLLSTIAGSMITVASLVFSITLVALSSAAQQYGPRLLNNFMRDTGYQTVLGTFVAAFLYSVLVLRQIKDVEGELTLPRLAVSFAVALAIAALALLIYFFHHAAGSIRVDQLVSHIGNELVEAVERSLKKDRGRTDRKASPQGGRAEFPGGAVTVDSLRTGYIETVDLSLLMNIAERNDVVLRLRNRAGAFILEGSPLIDVWPPDRLDEDLQAKLRDALGFGSTSFLPGDIESSLNDLREIALRALSPSLNTPNTAISCIDQLSRGLHRMAVAEKEAGDKGDCCSGFHHVDGRLRLVTFRLGLVEMIDLAFDQIRHHSTDLPAVSLRLLEALVSLGLNLDDPEARAGVLRQADMIVEAGQKWAEPWYRRRAVSLLAHLRR